MYNYPGNIHIHSTYSDGSGSIDQVAEAASAAGLKFIIISDHETLAGLPEESIRCGVVVLVGMEINRRHSHYLALDLERPVPSDEDNPQRVIDLVNEAGGFGFISHPFEKGSPYLEKGKAYPWKTWPMFRFSGLELWNYTSHWRGRDPSALKTLYRFFFNRKSAMDSPPPELLELWDCYTSAGHRLTAIGSSDAHATLYKIGFIKVPVFTYRYIFSTINTYITLTEKISADFGTAKKQINGALKEGRCYIAFESLAPGRDFTFYAEDGKNNFLMGSRLSFQAGINLHLKTPPVRSLMRLVKNGRVEKAVADNDLVYSPTGPGVYRVEVYFKPRFGRPRPWIYSNPIYIL